MNDKLSLLIIGNSNVGKSAITSLLLPNSKSFKGKSGKHPGSTQLIKSISHLQLPYEIIDLPGFGFMEGISRRREEHTKKQLILHIEKNHSNYFLALIIINILRIEDELTKYHSINSTTLPLSYELIQFLKEFNFPLLIIINKIDKVSDYHKQRIISLFVEGAKDYNITLVPLTRIENYPNSIPYLEFSALKKINLSLLKQYIEFNLPN